MVVMKPRSSIIYILHVIVLIAKQCVAIGLFAVETKSESNYIRA